jgi:hypothetical protein
MKIILKYIVMSMVTLLGAMEPKFTLKDTVAAGRHASSLADLGGQNGVYRRRPPLAAALGGRY